MRINCPSRARRFTTQTPEHSRPPATCQWQGADTRRRCCLPSGMVLFAGGGLDDLAVGRGAVRPKLRNIHRHRRMTEARLGPHGDAIAQRHGARRRWTRHLWESPRERRTIRSSDGDIRANGSMTAARALYTATLLPNPDGAPRRRRSRLYRRRSRQRGAVRGIAARALLQVR